MKIPKRIKIGPHIYEVKIDEKLQENHDKMGLTNHTKLKIVLDASQAPGQMEDTFIHEILHAINNQVGFVDKDYKEEESSICRLTPMLLQVIKDNWKVLK